MIEPAIADQFQPYLGAGERITWTGFPGQGLRFSSRDLYLVPFSVLWLGFAVFWEASVVRMGHAPDFFWIWGAMFIAIGLFFFVGRFFVDAWVRARTLYALTNQRALLLRRVSGEKLITANLGTPVVERSANEGGNLRFGPGAGAWREGGSFWGRGRTDFSIWVPALAERVEFVGIADVMSVYRLATPKPSAP